MSEASHAVPFTCLFCHNVFHVDLPTHVTVGWAIDGCRKCTVSVTAKRGTRIKYGAYYGRPHGREYADLHLQPDAIYTVARIKRWQHGTWVQLQETGKCSFNLRLFTPGTFYREKI